MKLKLLIPIAALAVSALTIASLDAVKIAFAPKEGTTLKFKMSAKGKMDVGGQAGEFTFTTNMTQKIEKVADGKATLVSDMEAPTITFMGQDVGMGAPASKNTTEYDLSDGRTLSSKSEPSEGDNPRLESLNQLIFPKTDVKEGDKWSYSSEAKGGANKVDFDYLYQGKETIMGIECFKIGVSAKEAGSDAALNMSATGIFWVDAMGLPVKVEQTVRNVVLAEGLPATDMTSTIERITGS